MMETVMARGEKIAQLARQRATDELVKHVAQRLPDAEIERLLSGFSIRDLLLCERWLADSELRFLSSCFK